ncbi:MAG: hypothetical protein WC406_03360 [Methanoregula sp.]
MTLDGSHIISLIASITPPADPHQIQLPSTSRARRHRLRLFSHRKHAALRGLWQSCENNTPVGKW